MFVRWHSRRGGHGRAIGPWHVIPGGANETRCGIRRDWHPHYQIKTHAEPRGVCRGCIQARRWLPADP